MAFKEYMVTDVKAVVESVVTDLLKALCFPPGPGDMKLNHPQPTQLLKAQVNLDCYPLAFSRGLYGTSLEMRDHAPRANVVMVSMETGPSSWFAPTEINGKMFNFLIDSGASRSIISRNFYDNLPEPRPNIQNTTTKFCVANGNVNKAAGICHFRNTCELCFWYRCR